MHELHERSQKMTKMPLPFLHGVKFRHGSVQRLVGRDLEMSIEREAIRDTCSW